MPKKNKRKKPPLLKRVKWEIERIPTWPRKIKWWLFHRFHPKHRYHIINTGLGYGWRDRDVLLEHLIVKLLIDFVEREKPFEHFDTKEGRHAAEWVRIKELYEFFNLHNPLELPYDELTPLLIEIVQLRKMLWT